MALYFESLLTGFILLLVFFNVALVLYYYNSFTYWKKKGVPYLKPSFPFGNIQDILMQKLSFAEDMKNKYDEFKKRGVRYGGFYSFFSPVFVPIDPEIVKQMMVKEFTHFQDRGLFYNETEDPLSAHLFLLSGPKWKPLRNKLTPTFTTGKIKTMFQTLISCGKNLEDTLEKIVKTAEPVDIKEIGARFTTDIISLCAFGLENSSLKDPDNEFRIYGKKIFAKTSFQKGRRILSSIVPRICKLCKVRNIDPDVSKFFMNIITQTVSYRENNNIDRNDMLNLLIKLKNNENIDNENGTTKYKEKTNVAITFNELAAQCFVFFVAGYETSSSAMTFALYELCKHQDIQDKLRKEVRTVLAKYNGEITYDAIMEMTYMEKVIYESLRKYPPLPTLHRICTQDWKIPGTNIVITKGTRVHISNYGMQMDPEYFPEPEKFDPERFSEEEKSKRQAFVNLPFGDGPRNCIGMRFGLMQTKVGLSIFLKNHRFKLDSKTVLPIEFDKNNFILSSKSGIWLQAERILPLSFLLKLHK